MREVTYTCGNCVYAAVENINGKYELTGWCEKHKKHVSKYRPACPDHIETVKSYREHQSKDN